MTFGWIKDSEGSTRNILRPGFFGITGTMCFQGGVYMCLWRLIDVCKLGCKNLWFKIGEGLLNWPIWRLP